MFADYKHVKEAKRRHDISHMAYAQDVAEGRRKSKQELREMLAEAVRNTARLAEKQKKPSK